jgi:putative transposase
MREIGLEGEGAMPRGRRLGAEQIVTKLRQIEVLQGQGKSLAAACKEAGTTEQSFYRWRKEFGGLNVDQAKRLKQLEDENGRLKKLVADLSLEKQVLRDIAQGKL